MSREPTRYPLVWPVGRARTPAADRSRAAFGRITEERGQTSSWKSRRPLTVAQAVDRIRREIRAFTVGGRAWVIDPDDVIISTNLRTRLDGLPYSNAAEPTDPGVAVYFQLRGKPHCLACDRWDRTADNLAAIAKFIEAMRGMERWGVGDVAALFSGFKALPPGGAGIEMPPPTMSVEDAASALFAMTPSGFPTPREILTTADAARRSYREAARRLHPDANGGAITGEWHRLQRAKEVLDRHHGGSR